MGRWASHGRDHVVVLRPIGNALAMHQLHFAPEVLSVEALGVESAKVREAELKLARQLIEQQSVASFDPAAYPVTAKPRIPDRHRGRRPSRHVLVSGANGESVPVPYRTASAVVKDGKLALSQSRFEHAPKVTREDLENPSDHAWRVKADRYWRSTAHGPMSK